MFPAVAPLESTENTNGDSNSFLAACFKASRNKLDLDFDQLSANLGMSRADVLEKHRAILGELGVLDELGGFTEPTVAPSMQPLPLTSSLDNAGPPNNNEDEDSPWTDEEDDVEYVPYTELAVQPALRINQSHLQQQDIENDLDLFLWSCRPARAQSSPTGR